MRIGERFQVPRGGHRPLRLELDGHGDDDSERRYLPTRHPQFLVHQVEMIFCNSFIVSRYCNTETLSRPPDRLYHRSLAPSIAADCSLAAFVHVNWRFGIPSRSAASLYVSMASQIADARRSARTFGTFNTFLDHNYSVPSAQFNLHSMFQCSRYLFP